MDGLPPGRQRGASGGDARNEALLSAYAVVTARRTAFDSMMWQVPTLAMTAQAFLLNVALGSGSARTSRVIAAVLGMALSAMSMQLMAKHRFLEVLDSQLSEKFERKLNIAGATGASPHARIATRAGSAYDDLPWWIRLSSYRLWLSGLLLFAVADGVSAVLAVVSPGVLR